LTSPRLVLASASPRRRDLLLQLGLDHEVESADVDEAVIAAETPAAHVERLARAKALAVAQRRPGALVFGGDTVVVLGDRILGKPTSAPEAVEMLLGLSGRTHEVFSGLALVAGQGGVRRCFARYDSTRVTFREFSREVAERYVAAGEPMDKAGAYGIQGLGAALVTSVEGDYTTVVGLSISGLLQLLDEAGWAYAFGRLIPSD
jgi:septum formation protein